jgi:hypothetical protein
LSCVNKVAKKLFVYNSFVDARGFQKCVGEEESDKFIELRTVCVSMATVFIVKRLFYHS